MSFSGKIHLMHPNGEWGAITYSSVEEFNRAAQLLWVTASGENTTTGLILKEGSCPDRDQ